MLSSHRALAAILPAVILLGATGIALGATLLVPEDHASINEALEASEWGDTILVGPGVYKESLILTDGKGDGIILRSTDGPESTVIAYAEVTNINEAVITYQRCSNSTQLIGFTVDGRGVARRGILANSNSKPVLTDLVIHSAEYGIASHRSSSPYIQDTTIRSTRTAALFVQGGSADAKACRFVDGEKFGVYIRGTVDPLRLRDCDILNNGQVGLQATEGEFTVTGGSISGNGDSGMILQDVSPVLTGVTIENHPNVGVVMEACWGEVVECTIRNNEYGAVISIEGEPRFSRCTFQDNISYHLGIEGDANPLIGGSPEHANRFLGEPAYAVQSSTTAKVDATHNFWDKPCVPPIIFQNTGGGRLRRKPWMSGNLLRVFNDCEASRKYHKKWLNGKLDEEGNPIGKKAQARAAARSRDAG